MAYRFGDLVQRAILRLAQVSGSGVQVYAEDIVAEMMQHKFDVLFEQRWWEDYSVWFTANLTDQGVVQEDLSDSAGADLDRYTDIQFVFYDNDPNPLPRRVASQNPSRYHSGGDSRPVVHEPWGANGKFFRVLPYGAERPVHLYLRQRPDTFEADSQVKMDDHLLILGTAYDYAEDDGTNPGAIAKLLNLYNARYDQVIASINEQPIPLGSGGGFVSEQPWGHGEAMGG